MGVNLRSVAAPGFYPHPNPPPAWGRGWCCQIVRNVPSFFSCLKRLERKARMAMCSSAFQLSLQALHPDFPAPRYSRNALLASPVGSNTCFGCHRKFSDSGAVRRPVQSPAFFPRRQSPQYMRLSDAGAGSGSLQVVFPASLSKVCTQHRSCCCAAALLV